MKKKKNKVAATTPKASKAGKKAFNAAKEAAKAEKRRVRDQRRATKLERRRREKLAVTGDMWAEPAPAHLVGRLERPSNKSKYHSYFEFAENTEKKDKKLEFQVTNNPNPPPGFKFVPIGDPTLTNACKELSRARDAMIFIVSGSKEGLSKVAEHMFRIGYHFRESIVDEASEIVGETAVSNRVYDPNDVEPIPESQAEINKQADGVIRDLFPRIPNTDREMILDHAFRKGATFHGEPTVGLQPGIPLSRRVQLAVLAHIRHTHTRYDRLLRETTWINARKVVEPICLDVLVKWRGDEETGRDQMEEILREVVVITDSEDSDDSSEEEESSEDEEGEVTSASSASISQPNSRNQHRPAQPQSEGLAPQGSAVPTNNRTMASVTASGDKKAQRGFKRYQAAWDEALSRQQHNHRIPEAGHGDTPLEGIVSRVPRSDVPSPYYDAPKHTSQDMSRPTIPKATYGAVREQPRYYKHPQSIARQDPYYSLERTAPATTYARDEVIVRPAAEKPPTYCQTAPRQGTPLYTTREQGLPQVVRGSPISNGLQDMLVPSIETASSDAVIESPHPDRIYEVYGGSQESHPRQVVERIVDRRRQSPASDKVIVIDVDSPQLKRRRVVYEDDSGHFRPLPPRDRDLYSTAPRADSYLLPTSSVQREFLVHHERPSQLNQGSYRNGKPYLPGHVVGERIPFYDAPPHSNYFASAPDRFRRVEASYVPIQRDGPPANRHVDSLQPDLDTVERPYYRSPANGDMRVIENDRTYRPQPEFGSRIFEEADESFNPHRLASREMRIVDNDRAYQAQPEVTSRIPVQQDGYQAFLDNSQSRLDPSLPRARDGFAASSSYQNPASQVDSEKRYQDQQPASFTTLRPGEARSPVRYVEKPMHIQKEQRPTSYGKDQTAPERYRVIERPPPIREYAQPPPEGDSPEYVKTVRRPLIVLD